MKVETTHKDGNLFSTRLFFGVPIDGTLEASLQNANSYRLALFIQNGDSYLQKVHREGRLYLGKYLPEKLELSQLELLEANIRSLMQQIVPEYVISKNYFVLFPTVESNISINDGKDAYN